MSFFNKLKEGLAKTKGSFDEKINNVFANFRKVDEELMDEQRATPTDRIYLWWRL